MGSRGSLLKWKCLRLTHFVAGSKPIVYSRHGSSNRQTKSLLSARCSPQPACDLSDESRAPVIYQEVVPIGDARLMGGA
jgi:hypothetical protein